ncbi:MAG: S8 family serine peptidase [Spirulinaceae cyanobacterium SM2_1_0]|nr:S8 family serine peptidase [Spirulinaceae cyanobacterium SM2_1_0]
MGLLLQRGGEELVLVKVGDRFTLRLEPPDAAFPAAIPHQQYQHLPQVNLWEISIAPEQLDVAMATARQQTSIAFASHVYQVRANPETLVYLTDEITVQFARDTPARVRAELTEALHLEETGAIAGLADAYVYRLTAAARENPLKLANRLLAASAVQLAEANVVIRQDSLYRPQDEFYPQQWYLHHDRSSAELAPGSHIDVERAWDITRGQRSIVVAITDDAIDINHPDFQGKGKLVAPQDFKGRDFLPLPDSDQESHGTACAGVAVAEENGQGVVGVAPGCALMPIRTTGFLDDQAVEQIFDWAVQKGASVISCSWGAAAVHFPLSLRQSAALNRAATQGRNGKGCVIVFAAGNANRPIQGTIYEQQWPRNLLNGPTDWLAGFALHPDVIAVAACTSTSKKSAYSNWGNQISVCAPSNNAPPGMWFQQTGFIPTAPAVQQWLPGLGIFTTDQLGALGYESGNFTRNFGGTSSACPVVAGVAALVLSVNPDLTATEVRQILQQTADKIVDRDRDPQLGLQLGTYNQSGHSQWFGYGKVNAYQAVKAAQQQAQTASPQPTQRRREERTVAIAIPDNDPRGIASPIEITTAAPLRDLQVTVIVEHTFLGDLEIRLRAPNGETALLQNRSLGTQTHLTATYNLTTTPVLRRWLGQTSAGRWHLWLVDCAPGDTGRLRQWTLDLGI